MKLIRTIVALSLLSTHALAQSQAPINVPTAGPMSATTFTTNFLNPALTALASCNWGPSAPANGPGAVPALFECWADTSVNPVTFKRWDGAAWTIWGELDTTAHQWTGSHNFKTVTINSTPASMQQGLVISQSSPAGGSFPSQPFNQIDVVDQGFTATGAAGLDNFGLLNINTMGLRVNYSTAGGDIRGALSGALRVTASNPGSYYGIGGSTYTNVTNAGLLWGTLGIAQVGPSGSASLIVGLEGEVAVYGGGTVAQRIGVSSNSQGPNAATTDLDAAYGVTLGGGTGGAAPYKKMFAISSVLYGGIPLASNADIFWYQPNPSLFPTLTIANVFNSLNWNVTGNIADFPNFGIKGPTGQAAFGAPISGIPANYQLWVTGGTSKGNIGLGVSLFSSTTGSSFVELLNATVGADLVLQANEAARTTTRYGKVLGNYNELTAFAGTGLIMGTQIGAGSVILGTNNVNHFEIDSSGLATIRGNTATGPTSLAGDQLRLLQVDGTTNRITLETAAANNVYGGRASGCTMASPCATPNLTSLLIIDGYGYTNAYTTSSNARIALMVDSVWSATNAATRISRFTTPTGTLTRVEAGRTQPSGGESIGALSIASDPGTGSLNMDSALTVGGTANIGGVATLSSVTATPAGGSTAARLLFGTTAGFGIYFGSGLPTVSAGQGSVYLRSDGSSISTRLYVNTNGSTTWTNFASAL